jgi:hypothetical protein
VFEGREVDPTNHPFGPRRMPVDTLFEGDNWKAVIVE